MNIGQVKVGKHALVRIDGQKVKVLVGREHPKGGWFATLPSGEKVKVVIEQFIAMYGGPAPQKSPEVDRLERLEDARDSAPTVERAIELQEQCQEQVKKLSISKLLTTAKRKQVAGTHIIVEARAGCLAADTLINVNRGGKGSRMTIERIVQQFNGQPFEIRREYFLNGKIVHSQQKTKPWNLSIPTKVAVAVNGVIRLARLKNAWFSGIKQTYTVTTNTGRQVRATSIHPFLTASGTWKRLEELTVGALVQVNVGRSKVGRSDEKIQYQMIDTRYHPHQINNGVGRHKVAKHRLVVEARMNKLSLPQYVVILRGDQRRCKTLKYLSTETSLVHHRNGDVTDNTYKNLKVITHKSLHSEEHEWDKNVLWQVGTEEIVSITPYKKEATYDLEVATEPHNFLANGFVVHNTGKTFTLIEGIKRIFWQPTKGVVGSFQQEEIWKAMLNGGRPDSAAFVAFNKSIAKELGERLVGIPGCAAMTMHSMGLQACKKVYTIRKDTIKTYKTDLLIERVKGADIRDLRKNDPTLLTAMRRLTELCKLTLQTPTEENLRELCKRFEVSLAKCEEEVLNTVPELVKLSSRETKVIDFADMIWLPIVNNLEVEKYDLLLVDEAQDLNQCQQALALKAGRRLIMVGDPRQSIYGFAGADTDSMPRMETLLGGTKLGCMHFPLTVTRRCGHAIVELAKGTVADFEAHKSNPPGQIEYDVPQDDAWKKMADKDMVLCRTNAPLVSLVFKLIKMKKKANIQGRNIGDALWDFIESLKAHSIDDLYLRLEDYYEKEMERLRKSKWGSEAAEIALVDKVACVRTLAKEARSVEGIKEEIDMIFNDANTEGIRLSSIHRAKGLEAQRVWIIEPGTLPHKMAKSPEQREQEANLYYVGITRAISELYFVEDSKKQMEDE